MTGLFAFPCHKISCNRQGYKRQTKPAGIGELRSVVKGSGYGLSGERDSGAAVVAESDGIGISAGGLDKAADGSHHAADLFLRGVLFEVGIVFVLDEFELLDVADAVVSVGGAHSLVDALLFGAEGIADFREGGGTDCGVDVADLTVGILGDLIALGGEPAAQLVHSFFKIVHTVIRLAL